MNYETELVTDSKTGLIAAGFEAADLVAAVLRYYEDPKLAERCAAEGQKQAVERFSIERWVDETERAYLEAAR